MVLLVDARAASDISSAVCADVVLVGSEQATVGGDPLVGRGSDAVLGTTATLRELDLVGLLLRNMTS